MTLLGRWLAALGLAGFTFVATVVALRFWELLVGQPRMMASNAHLGLIGGLSLLRSMS